MHRRRQPPPGEQRLKVVRDPAVEPPGPPPGAKKNATISTNDQVNPAARATSTKPGRGGHRGSLMG
jgi:hypothetical protein